MHITSVVMSGTGLVSTGEQAEAGPMSFPGTDILLAHHILPSPLQYFGTLSKTFVLFLANVRCGPSSSLSRSLLRRLAYIFAFVDSVRDRFPIRARNLMLLTATTESNNASLFVSFFLLLLVA